MAEFLGYGEEQHLPEYDELKAKNLCTDEEIKEIMKTRGRHSNAISKNTKFLRDYCVFIAYERKILKKLTNNEIHKSGIMSAVHYAIANNIKKLYVEGLQHFPTEYRLWDEYIKFLKFSNFKIEIQSTYEKMLTFHADKVNVWINAAIFQYDDLHNMEKVHDLFKRGLKLYPEDQEMRVAYVKILLTEASKMSDELNSTTGESPQSIEIHRIRLIYSNFKPKKLGIDYCIELLKVVEVYPLFTKKLQRDICEDMMNLFTRDEKMWHTLAQRELRGLHMSDLLGRPPIVFDNSGAAAGNKSENSTHPVVISQEDIERILKLHSRRRQIDLCYDVYIAALYEFKSQKIWGYFLDTMLKLNEDLSTETQLKQKKLLGALKAAHNLNLLDVTNYCIFIELLRETEPNPEEYILNILNLATARHPNCVKIWEQYMYHYILKNDDVKLEQIFRIACNAVGVDSYYLFRIMLIYQTTCNLPCKVEKYYEEACRINSPEHATFRIHYLDYVAVKCSLGETRQIYNELSVLQPPILELHEKMAYLESQALHPDMKKWRMCHENAVNYFGRTQTDVWMNYLKFERDSGVPKYVKSIFERAKDMLEPNLIDEFNSEVSLFMIGVVKP